MDMRRYLTELSVAVKTRCDGASGASYWQDAHGLQDFMDRHRIAVAIMPIDGALWARISAQIYNSAEDYERLIEAAQR